MQPGIFHLIHLGISIGGNRRTLPLYSLDQNIYHFHTGVGESVARKKAVCVPITSNASSVKIAWNGRSIPRTIKTETVP